MTKFFFDSDEDTKYKETKLNFPMPKKGQFIRVTFGENVLIGEVVEVEIDEYSIEDSYYVLNGPPINEDCCNYATIYPGRSEGSWKFTVIETPEPPVGATVVDRDGTIWIHKYTSNPGWVGTEKSGRYIWDLIKGNL